MEAFQHIERHMPDKIAKADLLFSRTADFKNPLATVKINYIAEPGATRFAVAVPVAARYVRWQVTAVSPDRPRNPGSQSIEFFGARRRARRGR